MAKKVYEQQAELKHYGIMGMKWGRRKAVSVGGSGHKARVKALSAQIKAKKKARSDASFKELSEHETRLIRSMAKVEKRRMKEIDASPGNKVTKFFKKMRESDMLFTKTINEAAKFEDNFYGKQRQIRKKNKKNRSAAEKQAIKDYEKKMDQRAKEISAKKPGFFEELKLLARADREESEALVERLLEIELETT